MYVAFYLLLNVAEDVAVERKMKKRDVVSYLMECVGTRGDVDLLVLCVTFLRKLSVRRENVEEMLRGDELDGERKSEVGTSGETSSTTSLSENENEPSATTSSRAWLVSSPTASPTCSFRRRFVCY